MYENKMSWSHIMICYNILKMERIIAIRGII